MKKIKISLITIYCFMTFDMFRSILRDHEIIKICLELKEDDKGK